MERRGAGREEEGRGDRKEMPSVEGVTVVPERPEEWRSRDVTQSREKGTLPSSRGWH